MSVLRSIPPLQLREALDDAGYKVVESDEYNWLMARGDDDLPVVIPKRGEMVSVTIMQHLGHHPDDRLRTAVLEAARKRTMLEAKWRDEEDRARRPPSEPPSK
jgi:hypothetical protein